MNKLPVLFGYAGTIPFIIFMLITFLVDEETQARVVTALQMSYGAMILSFLGGIHWGQAVPTSNNKQLSFSMIPTVTSLGLIVWGMVDPVLPLLLMAALFWVVYYADKKYMPVDYIAEGYFVYRRNLTVIVSGTLIISFLALV